MDISRTGSRTAGRNLLTNRLVRSRPYLPLSSPSSAGTDWPAWFRWEGIVRSCSPVGAGKLGQAWRDHHAVHVMPARSVG